jgi:FdhE protein
MSEILDNIKEQISLHRKRNPVYRTILDFYERVIEAQENVSPSLEVILPEISEELKSIQTREGFPLISPNDFVLDLPSSVKLFESMCHISKNATEKMRENIQAIEGAITINALNLRELLKRHADEAYLNAVAEEFAIDDTILKFLVRMSTWPSVRTNVEVLKDRVDLKNWLRGYCPICGSAPNMSALRAEGKRFFQCSFCGFHWPAERLACPFCGNGDHERLHYLYAEGQEQYRADLCDKCKQYIKTVDTRKTASDPDLNIEDIATMYLDILASEKGFERPVPSYWGM